MKIRNIDKLANKIICGDALKVLRQFPSGFIDCVVTSPPYWALRDYKVKPQIWDGDENCKHNWKKHIKKPSGGKRGKRAKVGANKNDFTNMRDHNIETDFCLKCNAWRGSLGLEPTFELYIKHLCAVFDEVKRALKKTGSCFVNIGDTYFGSGGSAGHTPETKNLGRKTFEYGAYPTGSLARRRKDRKKYGGKSGTYCLRGRGFDDYQDKCLCMIPFRFAIEMVNRGWILRNAIIWHKPNCMPSSVKDRFTVDFEYLFFFSKSKKYYFKTQHEPVKQCSIERLNRAVSNKHKWVKGPDGQTQHTMNKPRPNRNYKRYERSSAPHEFKGADHLVSPFDPKKGRNKRCVWTITTKPFKEAHFAVYPEDLVETPIKAGCPEDGVVLDPFSGAGTTLLVAKKLGRNYIGVDINPRYVEMSKNRIKKTRYASAVYWNKRII